MESYIGDARAAAADARAAPRRSRRGAAAVAQKASSATGRRAADLAALPRQLERIDGWIGEGLLGGEQPNAADLQIGSTSAR